MLVDCDGMNVSGMCSEMMCRVMWTKARTEHNVGLTRAFPHVSCPHIFVSPSNGNVVHLSAILHVHARQVLSGFGVQQKS